MEVFNQNDWDHLHGVVLGTTNQKLSQLELEQLYESLPDNLKSQAISWGMNDTVFKDNLFEYLKSL